MNYWLMKSEPDAFSLDDLCQLPYQISAWDGVRNYQARNMLRDQMKVGDLAFFYYSSCKVPGIAGIIKIIKSGYPDLSAFDPNSQYYDPKSKADKPQWFMVDVKYMRHLKRFITLELLRQQPALKDLILLRKGNRLSIMPLSKEEWDTILTLE